MQRYGLYHPIMINTARTQHMPLLNLQLIYSYQQYIFYFRLFSLSHDGRRFEVASRRSFATDAAARRRSLAPAVSSCPLSVVSQICDKCASGIEVINR